MQHKELADRLEHLGRELQDPGAWWRVLDTVVVCDLLREAVEALRQPSGWTIEQGINEAHTARMAIKARLKPGELMTRQMIVDEMQRQRDDTALLDWLEAWLDGQTLRAVLGGVLTVTLMDYDYPEGQRTRAEAKTLREALAALKAGPQEKEGEK